MTAFVPRSSAPVIRIADLAYIRFARRREEFTLARLLAAKRAYSAQPRPWAGRRFCKPQAA